MMFVLLSVRVVVRGIALAVDIGADVVLPCPVVLLLVLLCCCWLSQYMCHVDGVVVGGVGVTAGIVVVNCGGVDVVMRVVMLCSYWYVLCC